MAREEIGPQSWQRDRPQVARDEQVNQETNKSPVGSYRPIKRRGHQKVEGSSKTELFAQVEDSGRNSSDGQVLGVLEGYQLFK